MEKEKSTKKTPILGLVGNETEAVIEAYYAGYVQGVKDEAKKALDGLQRKMAEPVGKAHKTKLQAMTDASAEKHRRESAMAEEFRRRREALAGEERSAQDALSIWYRDERDAVIRAFQEIVRPLEASIEVHARALAADASTKITKAGVEFSSAHEAAKARRLEAERVARETVAAS
jgi:hypothetical protein